MARRGGTLRFPCEEPGCLESALVGYDTKADARQTADSAYYKNYRCSRHRNPEQVLSLDNSANQCVYIATQVMYKNYRGEEEPLGLFWRRDGETRASSGLNTSDAHKAWAKDFPEGTRLVITAYVETPEQAQVAQDAAALARPTGEQQ